MSNRLCVVVVLVVVALVCMANKASAQDPAWVDNFTNTNWGLLSGNIYITEGNSNIYVVKPDASGIKIVEPISTQQAPLAVITSGTPLVVRTTTLYSGSYGADYDLGGNYLGGHYPQTAAGTLRDGTSDGTTYNYELDTWVQSDGSQRVYRCNADWSNPTVLFSIISIASGGLGGFNGITYDPSGGGSLWLSTDNVRNGGQLEHVSLTGSVISSSPLVQDSSPNWPHMVREYFGPPVFYSDYGHVGMNWPAGLMRDPSTGYLWVESIFDGMGWFAGYDSSGNFIGALSWSSLNEPIDWYHVSVSGGEIAQVPEPSSVLLLAVGAVSLATFAWQPTLRKRTRAYQEKTPCKPSC
jgi:hypothetical protein